MGKGTHIKGAIVDKNARIGKFCKIINAEGIQVRRWGAAARRAAGWRAGDSVLHLHLPAACSPCSRRCCAAFLAGSSPCPALNRQPPTISPVEPIPSLRQESFKTEDDGWVIRDGVVVVIKDSNIPDGGWL